MRSEFAKRKLEGVSQQLHCPYWLKKRLLAPLVLIVCPFMLASAQSGEYISVEYFQRLSEPYSDSPGKFTTVASVIGHHFNMAQSMSKSYGIVEELAFITTTKYYRYFGVIPSETNTVFIKQFLYALQGMATDDSFVRSLLLMSREYQGEGQYLKRRVLSSLLNSYQQIAKGNRNKYSKMPLSDVYDIVDLALHEKPSYMVANDLGENPVLPTSQADLGKRSNTYLMLCLLLTERDFSAQAIRARSIIEQNTPADLFVRSNERRKEYEFFAEELSTVRSDSELRSIISTADPRYLSWLFQQRIKAKRHENLEKIVCAIVDAGDVERAAAVFHYLVYPYKEFVLGGEAEGRLIRKTCIISDPNAGLDSRICAMALRYYIMVGRRPGNSSLQVTPLDYESLYPLCSTSSDPLVTGLFAKLVSLEGSAAMQDKAFQAAQQRCLDNPCFSSILDYVMAAYKDSQWEMTLGLPAIVP